MSSQATCAACGLAIRKRARFVLVGCHALHAHCESLSRHMWQHELDNQDRERAFKRRIEELDHMAVTLRSEIASEKAKRTSMVTPTPPAPRQPVLVTAASLARGGPVSAGSFDDLKRLALGLAWGRGLWGLSRYFAKLVMDKKDDSEARFGLIELM